MKLEAEKSGTCGACDRLLTSYLDCVATYTKAVGNLRGLLADDFNVALKYCFRLERDCMEADNKLVEHWERHHGRIAPRVKRLNGCSVGR